MPDPLIAQIGPLHELVRANGWPLLVVDGIEADDVIGTLARQARAAGIDTLISTSDKDLAQLVEPGITLVNTMINERLDHDGVVARFGVRPDQVLDFLTLTGDAVDNVPGVSKVGPKTAAKWLAQYGDLENLLAHQDEIAGVVGDNLRGARDWLPQGRRLLTVKVDCELPLSVTDLKLEAPDAERLRALYERFEFRSWLRDADRSAGADHGVIADQAHVRPARLPREGSRRGRRASTRHAVSRNRHPMGRPAPARPLAQGPRRARTTRWSRTTTHSSAGPWRSRKPTWCRSTPRRRASIRCRPRSSASRCRSSRPPRATSRSDTAMRARRHSFRSPRCCSVLRPGSPIRRGANSART